MSPTVKAFIIMAIEEIAKKLIEFIEKEMTHTPVEDKKNEEQNV